MAQAIKEPVTRINLRLEPAVAEMLDRYIEHRNRELAPGRVDKTALINHAVERYILDQLVLERGEVR